MGTVQDRPRRQPRRRLTPRLWERLARVRAMGGCTLGNSRLWSWSPVGTVQDRPRRQPRRRLTPRLCKALAHVRAGGVAPRQFAPRVLVPGGDRSGPTEAAAETAAYAALAGEASARPRRGVAPRVIRACGPGPRWGPFRTDRGGSRDGGSTPRLWERLARVRAMGFWGRPPPGISPSLH